MVLSSTETEEISIGTKGCLCYVGQMLCTGRKLNIGSILVFLKTVFITFLSLQKQSYLCSVTGTGRNSASPQGRCTPAMYNAGAVHLMCPT